MMSTSVASVLVLTLQGYGDSSIEILGVSSRKGSLLSHILEGLDKQEQIHCPDLAEAEAGFFSTVMASSSGEHRQILWYTHY